MRNESGITITGANAVQIDPPVMLSWSPKPDIETYELAQAVPLFSAAGWLTRSKFDALPDNVKRHFEVL